MKTSTLATALAATLIATTAALAFTVTAGVGLISQAKAQTAPATCGKDDTKCLGPRGLNDAARYRFEKMLAGCPALASSNEADEIRRLLNQPVDGTWNSRLDKADAFASKCKK